MNYSNESHNGNIIKQLFDLKKEAEEKSRKIVELENAVIKYQIMRRSESGPQRIEVESSDVSIYKEEIINLKTKLEYLRIENKRESLSLNNKINEYKIKYEETNKVYKNCADNLNLSLLNLENVRNHNKEREIKKMQKLEVMVGMIKQFYDTIECINLELCVLNISFKDLHKQYEYIKKENLFLRKKLCDYKALTNKKNDQEVDEFYEEEITNLLTSCDVLTEENKKLTFDLLELKAKINAVDNTVKEEVNKKKDITKYIDSINQLSKQNEQLCRKLEENNNEKNKLTRLNIERIKYLEQYKEDARSKNIEIACKENANNELKKMIEQFKVEIENRYREAIVASNPAEVGIKCNLCDHNNKSVAIISCMHTFCEECIENRIKVRDRKYPTCGRLFNTNDVKKIYL